MTVHDSQGQVADIRFAAKLRRQFEGLDENAGKKTRRGLVITVVAAALTGAIIGSLAIVVSGSTKAPDASQMSAMQATVAGYLTARSQALAPQDPAYQSNNQNIAQSVYDNASAEFRSAVARFGTPEFVGRESNSDLGFMLAGMRTNGDVMVSSHTQVLGVDYMRTLDNGDIVVWAKLWLGDIRRHFDSGEVGVGRATTEYVDETPTYQYQMRNVGGRWKIVSEALVFESEDGAATAGQFGPATPHDTGTEPLVSGNKGLILDAPTP